MGTSRRRPGAYFRPGLGGAGVPVPSLPRSWGVSSRFGETPQGWGSPAIGGWGSPGARTKRLFGILAPDRREGAREAPRRRGPRRKGALEPWGGEGARLPARAGPAAGSSTRAARLPAAGPPGAEVAGRRAGGPGEAGAGRGGWDHLGAAGACGEEVLPGGGRARRGGARASTLISAWSPPLSGVGRPAAGADAAGRGSFVCR